MRSDSAGDRQSPLGALYAGATTTALWVVPLLTLCTFSCDGCQKPANRAAPNAGYVELVSLSRSSNAAHTIEVFDTDGHRWWREPEPGVDLSQCAYEEAFPSDGPDGVWCVVLPVRSSRDQALLTVWLGDREGGDVGVVLGGRLVQVVKNPGSLHGYVCITAFESEEEARREAEFIRMGARP